MRRLIFAVVLVSLAGCNDRQHGERCNPLQYSESGTQGDCADGLSCIYPTAPNCGVAYCCLVLASGKMIDPDPNCRPDPSLAPVCMLDMSDPPDGGSGD